MIAYDGFLFGCGVHRRIFLYDCPSNHQQEACVKASNVVKDCVRAFRLLFPALSDVFIDGDSLRGFRGIVLIVHDSQPHRVGALFGKGMDDRLTAA